ncbi:hypothetical protein BD769DRAFT_1637996 [Suillus cothurnatus]|nr:hypothetical protein BD769DRAFT_1637996 [Suillus cothurnatus]
MSEQSDVFGLLWNDNISVATITLISYDYLLLLDKEIQYVWKRPWSRMSILYLIVRYFGLVLALLWGFSLGGGLLYMPESATILSCLWNGAIPHIVVLHKHIARTEFASTVILIWRLYALYNRSKLLLRILLGLFLPIVAASIGADVFLYSRPSMFFVNEIITPDATYCTFLFRTGFRPATYWSIPMISFDVLLVILAAAKLGNHIKERKELRMRPNSSISMIVRLHIIPVTNIAELFNSVVPYILAPRLTISIWDTHAYDKCVYVSKAFEDCKRRTKSNSGASDYSNTFSKPDAIIHEFLTEYVEGKAIKTNASPLETLQDLILVV